MKSKSSNFAATVRMVVCFSAVLWLAGCATPRVDWNARVGNYTYQQAVLDMGPPDREAKLADNTIVGEWLLNRGYTYFTGGPGYYGQYWASQATAYTTPNRFVRLTFDSDGRLTAWKRVYR